jgi:hypothetical protein
MKRLFLSAMVFISAFSYAQELSVEGIDKVIKAAYQKYPDQIVQGNYGRAPEGEQIRLLGCTEREYIQSAKSKVDRSGRSEYFFSHYYQAEHKVAQRYKAYGYSFNYAAIKRYDYILNTVDKLEAQMFKDAHNGMTWNEYQIHLEKERVRKLSIEIKEHDRLRSIELAKDKARHDSIEYIMGHSDSKRHESDSIAKIVIDFINSKVPNYFYKDEDNKELIAHTYHSMINNPTYAVLGNPSMIHKDGVKGLYIDGKIDYSFDDKGYLVCNRPNQFVKGKSREFVSGYFSDSIYRIIIRNVELENSFDYRIDSAKILEVREYYRLSLERAEKNKLEELRLKEEAKIKAERDEAIKYLPNEDWFTSHPRYEELIYTVIENQKSSRLWDHISRLNNPLNLQVSDCKYDNKSLHYEGTAAFDTYEDFVGQLKYNLTGAKYKKPKVKQPKTKFSLNPVSAPPAGATIIKKK